MTTPTWTLDPSHSSATFSVRHMMITNVRGAFAKLSGSASFDPANLEGASFEASIDVASIDTRDEKRDAHLRSGDFFDAEHHPALTFRSRALRRTGSKLELVGDLTIRGTTREVVLDVDGPTEAHVDPWGNTRVGAEAKAKIKRSDFGITWNSALEAGGVLVGDEVSLMLDVSLVRQK